MTVPVNCEVYVSLLFAVSLFGIPEWFFFPWRQSAYALFLRFKKHDPAGSVFQVTLCLIPVPLGTKDPG
ncbi:MAG: hypothetical protein CSA33_00365 [Desulfobulbus propionicus]|nr:MAG: hypothetical protein CSA33_00365 [Desulfobulbus propionicus]